MAVDYELDDVAEERTTRQRRKRETKEERQSRKAKGRKYKWGNGAVSQGLVKDTASQSMDRNKGGDRNRGESGGLGNLEDKRRVKPWEYGVLNHIETGKGGVLHHMGGTTYGSGAPD